MKWLRMLTLLNPLQAEKFTILLEVEDGARKLFTVQYRRVGGELEYMVHLAYFEHTRGILLKSRLDGPAGTTSQVDAVDVGGRTTTHLAKYSHHRNGLAL